VPKQMPIHGPLDQREVQPGRHYVLKLSTHLYHIEFFGFHDFVP